jgi:hypothetical protein
MEEYLKKVIRIADEVVASNEGSTLVTKVESEPSAITNGSALHGPSDAGAGEYTETLSYDRAKKINRRIEYFYNLREKVITDPMVLYIFIIACRKNDGG